ncbi:hypothetical protein BDR04DRAFT_1159597 [Suillus decipiens]|nr:hypothetical protein BDR04DRAFT_1159597 [Suillus decipiens]
MSNDKLEGPESLTEDKVAATFDEIEQRIAELPSVIPQLELEGYEISAGRVDDLAELEQVDKGIMPAAFEDDVQQVGFDLEDNISWDVQSLLTMKDLGGTQSAKRCNLSVRTFETLGKVRANLRYHVHLKNVTDGKPTRRRHAHMHTTELPGIDTEVAKQLETDFAFVPPLSAVSSDNLKGPESISLDDMDAEFARLEDIRNVEKKWTEFASDWDHVDEGLVPAAIEDEIMVTDHDVNEDGTWNISSMLLSSGLTSMYHVILPSATLAEHGSARFCRFCRQNYLEIVLPTAPLPELICLQKISKIEVVLPRVHISTQQASVCSPVSTPLSSKLMLNVYKPSISLTVNRMIIIPIIILDSEECRPRCQSQLNIRLAQQPSFAFLVPLLHYLLLAREASQHRTSRDLLLPLDMRFSHCRQELFLPQTSCYAQ